LRENIGQTARQQIEERNWEKSIDRVREVYAEAIQTKAGPARGTWRARVAQLTTVALVSAFRTVPAKPRRRRKVSASVSPAVPLEKSAAISPALA
jgi:hypothetical protein